MVPFTRSLIVSLSPVESKESFGDVRRFFFAHLLPASKSNSQVRMESKIRTPILGTGLLVTFDSWKNSCDRALHRPIIGV